MYVGITYDLQDDYLAMGYSPEETAEFDKKETIDAINDSLEALGHKTMKIGQVKNLVELLAAGERWDVVFNIAEGMYGAARESQIPAILDAYRIPYTFSDPLVLAVALDKSLAKRIVRPLGVPTPEFRLVKSEEDIGLVDLKFPLFAKPVAEGTSKGVSALSVVENRQQLDEVCRKLLVEFNQPVLLETFLPGREFTVGITGTGKDSKAIGAIEVKLLSGADIQAYSYHNKSNFREIVRYELAEDSTAEMAMDIAVSAWNALGCRDCGRVDLRCDRLGIPNFIEVNPLAGLNPVVSDLPILCYKKGLTYENLIEMIMDSTVKRVFSDNGKDMAGIGSNLHGEQIPQYSY